MVISQQHHVKLREHNHFGIKCIIVPPFVATSIESRATKKTWENLIYFKTRFVSRCFKIYKICSNFCEAASSVTIRMPRHYPQDIQTQLAQLQGEMQKKNGKQMAITSNSALFPIILNPPRNQGFGKNLPKQMGPYSGGVQYYRGGIM